ncbi:MAG: 50S ribosomal protein L44e [Candidatus Micrarchaeota archaeon]|nr:50S ribosomal protein L44e [Candidatus Micrarchaeota archaeon]
MKMPKEIRTYCKYCNKHTTHTVKLASKSPPRSLAIGTRKHERKLKGHGGKRAGKVPVKKQGKRQVVMLSCVECKKKTPRTIGTRTRKKLEIIAK